ncbi:MAG: Tfp pilus assembly protein PilE, partial [Gammaproteobacteria bacterium]
EQEKRFPNQNTYTANLADLGLETDFTPKGLYALKATISASGDTFLITAKPVPGKSQADDVECLEISINSVNQRLPAVCWGG